jgi:membrane-associated phospholipid phosphatase
VTRIKRLLKENPVYFSAFLLYLLIGGVLLLQIESGDIIRFVNGRHTDWGDGLFRWGTKMGEEPAYLLLTLAFFFWRPRVAMLLPLTGIVVTIVSYLTKGFFAHPRPATYFLQQGVLDSIRSVEGVVMHTGLSSFPSGHTMSAFALYTLLALLLPWKRGWALLMFLLAFMVALSRMYLVQHFLKDVYLGAIIGVALAMIIYLIQLPLANDPGKWYNRKVTSIRSRKQGR